MRRIVRGIAVAVAARPWLWGGVALAVAALNVLLPPLVLSLARKPVDYATFNPWLRRLPGYLLDGGVPLATRLGKTWDLAIFWFSADSPFGGVEWGYSVSVSDLARIGLLALLCGTYFALWAQARSRPGGGPPQGWPRRVGPPAGLAGAFTGLLGLSTGPCSVMGCGAPVLPVVGLAFIGLSSGSLALLGRVAAVATPLVLGGLGLGVLWLGWQVGGAVGRAKPRLGAGGLGLLLLAALAAPATAAACGDDARGLGATVEYWVAALGDPDPRIRARAAAALGELRDELAVVALRRALADPDPDVRREARKALARLGSHAR